MAKTGQTMGTEGRHGRKSFIRLSDRFALFSSPRWSRSSLPSPLSSIVDPLAEPIAQGVAAGHRRRPDRPARLRARAIRDQARATGCYEGAILELTGLIFLFPSSEQFQKIAARLLSEMHDERALGAWLGISLRFPSSLDAFQRLTFLVNRHKGRKAGYRVIRARFARIPRRLDELLAYAEACDIVGATAERRAAFERLARMFRNRKESWLLTASWLDEEVGIHRVATTFLRSIAAGTALRVPFVHRRRLHSVVPDLEVLEGAGAGAASIASVRVLGTLFNRVIEHRIARRSAQPRSQGSVVLLTGSLGSGGAERQLVNTAVGLSGMSLEQRTLQDGIVLDRVEVVARSLRERKDGAFYLSDLEKAGVKVHSYRELPDFADNLAASAVRPALGALGYLPWSTAEAVIKLTDWLKATNPEVVHIWQDGLVYAAGFAALLAGVPRIILSGRSTPPPDRRERYLVEYDVIYKSLLQAPGVVLSVNSHYGAKRYAAWLGIDVERIVVVPNGVARPLTLADSGAISAFREFEERTGPCSLTLGAVMRLDEVKRPLHWMKAAAKLLGRIPSARFIIVGDGPFRAKMERQAESRGMSERCLFVGRSECVGYWLAQMDALMLVSEHEGLPNALIEAQLAGVPVITTAAGGASETLVPGRTGIVLPTAASPGDFAEAIAGLAAETGRLQKMGAAGQEWAREAFPVRRMLTNTLAVYAAAGQAGVARMDSQAPTMATRRSKLRYGI